MDLSGWTFNQVWSALQARIRPPQKVRNWTALNDYLGDMMTVVAVHSGSIEVDAPGAKSIQVVRKQDFEAVFNIWEGYKSNEIERQELTPLTRFSKYVISILHWLESES